MMKPPVGAITLCSISRFARRHAHGWWSRSSGQSPSTLVSFFEDFLRDDELHDLAGPLVDLGYLRIAVVALGRKVFQIAIAPEDLHAIAAGFDRDVAREELRLGSGEDVILARVLQSRRAPGQQAGSVDLGRHVREHPLDRPEIGDPLTERLALLGKREGVHEARARDPDRLRRDRDTAAVERRERDPEPLARLAEEIRARYACVLEDQLGGVRPADPELFLELADGEPRGPLLDDERGDPLVFLCRVCLREDDGDVRERSVGDEVLGPVQDPAVAVASRGRAHSRGVAARRRFGERKASDPLATRELRQVFLLLGIASVMQDRVDRERHVRAEHHAGRRARAVDLLDDQGVRQRVETRATVPLGHVRAHEAEGSHLAEELWRDLALIVDLSRAREDPLGRKFARGPLGELLLLGEGEVEARLRGGHRHCRTPKTRPSGSRAKKKPSRISPTFAPFARARSNVAAKSSTWNHGTKPGTPGSSSRSWTVNVAPFAGSNHTESSRLG